MLLRDTNPDSPMHICVTVPVLKNIRNAFRRVCGGYKSSHVNEAMALMFGFQTNAAFIARLKEDGSFTGYAEPKSFLERLRELGYPDLPVRDQSVFIRMAFGPYLAEEGSPYEGFLHGSFPLKKSSGMPLLDTFFSVLHQVWRTYDYQDIEISAFPTRENGLLGKAIVTRFEYDSTNSNIFAGRSRMALDIPQLMTNGKVDVTRVIVLRTELLALLEVSDTSEDEYFANYFSTERDASAPGKAFYSDAFKERGLKLPATVEAVRIQFVPYGFILRPRWRQKTSEM